LWQASDYCGIQILTYEILSNHFHLLVRVPQEQPVSDVELLRRYRVLHSKRAARIRTIEGILARDEVEAEKWRRRQLARMGDVSTFMQLLKQRFSIWFNRSHDRFGTLWAERFKNVLVESGRALETMAAYINLNCVRAGIVADPSQYRFSGYAEAVAGNERARAGICWLMGLHSWEQAQALYRQILFGVGASAREGAATIRSRDLQRVQAEGGRMPMAVVLRCRLRYFTDGAVLGSRAFVESYLRRRPLKTGKLMRPQPLPSYTDWGDLTALRGLKPGAAG
jgi:REP element-mobilizing transposase RayT